VAAPTRKARKRKRRKTAPEELDRRQRPLHQPAPRTQNKLAQGENRWQRIVRYGWDKKRG
jgi:hypothetical protein